MKPPPATTLIVRIWLEPTEPGPIWRASVTDVRTQERRYFQDADALARFLVPHLERSRAHGDPPHPG